MMNRTGRSGYLTERRRLMVGSRRAWWALGLGGMLVLGGCATAPVTDRQAILAASQTPYATDIPLPRGFVLVDQSSEDWSSGSLRYLRHHYRGRADKHAVRVFYREQMVLVRWTPVSESSIHGSSTLSFERDDETCVVTVEGARAGVVTVDVLITPTVRRSPASGR